MSQGRRESHGSKACHMPQNIMEQKGGQLSLTDIVHLEMVSDDQAEFVAEDATVGFGSPRSVGW